MEIKGIYEDQPRRILPAEGKHLKIVGREIYLDTPPMVGEGVTLAEVEIILEESDTIPQYNGSFIDQQNMIEIVKEGIATPPPVGPQAWVQGEFVVGGCQRDFNSRIYIVREGKDHICSFAFNPERNTDVWFLDPDSQGELAPCWPNGVPYSEYQMVWDQLHEQLYYSLKDGNLDSIETPGAYELIDYIDTWVPPGAKGYNEGDLMWFPTENSGIWESRMVKNTFTPGEMNPATGKPAWIQRA